MNLYEQISIIIFFGLFLLLAADTFQSSRMRKFFKKGYLEEKKKRADYREEKLIKESDMQVDITSLCMDVEVLKQQSDKILHDLQQIKTRLTWSRNREKKDLKAETPTHTSVWSHPMYKGAQIIKTGLSGKTKKIVVDKTKKKK